MRVVPLETRFAVSSAGILGYECNLSEMSSEEIKEIKEQIVFYKKYRSVLQFGDYYRGKCGVSTAYEKDIYTWNVVGQEKKKSVGVYLQGQMLPNTPCAVYRASGLEEEADYRITNRFVQYNIKIFGDLVNAVAPIHIKKDSLLHNTLAKLIKMDGERDEYIVSGSVLNHAGITLKQGFCGTGFDGDVRFSPDYSARVYLMEQVERGKNYG
jgi:alpha-galactosidase